jgi:hypothetical protein
LKDQKLEKREGEYCEPPPPTIITDPCRRQSIFCWKYFFRAAFEVFLKVSQSFFPNQIKSKVQGHFPLAYFRWRISVGNFWS